MLRYLLQNPFEMPSYEDREEIVVITDTLAHTANSFVELGRSIVVDKVNDKVLRSLKHLNELLKDPASKRLRVDFVDDDEPWILDMAEIRKADADINKRYSVQPSVWLESLSVDAAIGKEDVK
ncbi:MAG: hypothetical protein NTV34_03910 [Proteobacteria bacterium]|nr:hypothetical protein [Pseudomonadota bacterium]